MMMVLKVGWIDVGWIDVGWIDVGWIDVGWIDVGWRESGCGGGQRTNIQRQSALSIVLSTTSQLACGRA